MEGPDRLIEPASYGARAAGCTAPPVCPLSPLCHSSPPTPAMVLVGRGAPLALLRAAGLRCCPRSGGAIASPSTGRWPRRVASAAQPWPWPARRLAAQAVALRPTAACVHSTAAPPADHRAGADRTQPSSQSTRHAAGAPGRPKPPRRRRWGDEATGPFRRGKPRPRAQQRPRKSASEVQHELRQQVEFYFSDFMLPGSRLVGAFRDCPPPFHRDDRLRLP